MNKAKKAVNTKDPTPTDFNIFATSCLEEIVHQRHLVSRTPYKDVVTYQIDIDVTPVLGPMNINVESWDLISAIVNEGNKQAPAGFSLKISSMGRGSEGLHNNSRWLFIEVNIKKPNKFSSAFNNTYGKNAQSFNRGYAQHLVVKMFSEYCYDESVKAEAQQKYPDNRLAKHIKQEEDCRKFMAKVSAIKAWFKSRFSNKKREYDY